MADDCLICGNCWWEKCEEPADYELDVNVKRHGRPLYNGTVDLCATHADYAVRSGGHLNLKWAAIEQAHARRVAS